MLLYCSGVNPLIDSFNVNDLYFYCELFITPMCFAVEVDSDGAPMATKAPSLPCDIASMSHGSDGEKLVIVVAKLYQVGHSVMRLLS